MEWQPVKQDISISLAELDVGPSGESVFNIRPELSRKTLNNDTWLANIQPNVVQNSATANSILISEEYPWLPVDKSRLEVPQTNIYHRAYFIWDAKPPPGIIANPPIYATTARSRVIESKDDESHLERFDPTLGNSLDSGNLNSDKKFIAFPTGLNRSILNISPIECDEIYPDEDDGSTVDRILNIEDIKIKHERRSMIDIFSPIRQVVTMDTDNSRSDLSNARIGVRTYGGASIVNYISTNDNDSFEVSALASLSFLSKDYSQSVNSVDMVPNPYFRNECLVTSDAGYVGAWDYESRPRAFLDDLQVNLPGGTKNLDLRDQWFSCKFASHPRTFYMASSRKVDLCDMRARPNTNARLIFSMPEVTRESSAVMRYLGHNKICALAVPPKAHSYEVAVATDRNILLFDTRYSKKSIFHWQHHLLQFPPDRLEYVTDEVNGNNASQILAWNRYSTSVHVFEYANTDALSEDIIRSVDLSYNTTPFPSNTTRDVKYSYQQDKAYYVAPRQLYGLPTCRYRPANMAWVTPYPKGKVNELRENPTLLGLKILPGMAQSMKKSSSLEPKPSIRSWCMLQLCDDGSLYSKLWCRNASNQLSKSTLSSFHRSSTNFHDIQDEYLKFCKEEIKRDSKVADLAPIFQDFKSPSNVNLVHDQITAEQLEDKIFKSVKHQTYPQTLFEILREGEHTVLGNIEDDVIAEVEKRLTSSEAALERKIWHNNIEEDGLIDPVSLDLGGQIRNAKRRLKDACHINLRDKDVPNMVEFSSINGAIQQIAIDLTASRHIYGNLPASTDEITDTQTSESTVQSSHSLFPNLFNSTELAERANAKINPAAIALASDWDISSDANNYQFRRLDGLSMEEVLQTQQKAKKRKRREKASSQFSVQDSQSFVPDVGVASSRSAASKITASLPNMDDLEFSTQWNPPTPEKTRTTESFFSASQPVPGPFGTRNAKAKKKKKRSQGF
ncbi:hypothetical protein NQZ79_g4665 [Umbelopsis isabellina]|nr:hypothetical protein NQZ79_g4665 [Umbelopsis isabellina]